MIKPLFIKIYNTFNKFDYHHVEILMVFTAIFTNVIKI